MISYKLYIYISVCVCVAIGICSIGAQALSPESFELSPSTIPGQPYEFFEMLGAAGSSSKIIRFHQQVEPKHWEMDWLVVSNIFYCP